MIHHVIQKNVIYFFIELNFAISIEYYCTFLDLLVQGFINTIDKMFINPKSYF